MTSRQRRYDRARLVAFPIGLAVFTYGGAVASPLVGIPCILIGSAPMVRAWRAWAEAPLIEARTEITRRQKQHALDRYRALLDYNAQLEQTIRELRHPSGRPDTTGAGQ